MQFHYWINPQGKEIKVREHVPYILDHPEEFGYDPDEIRELSQNDEWVEPILDEVIFEKGWIRVYGFHGEITISSKNRNRNKDRIYQFLSDHADELYRIRDIEFYFGGNRVINVSMHIRDFLANPDPLFEENNNSKFATLVESLLLEFDIKKTINMLGTKKFLDRIRSDRTFVNTEYSSYGPTTSLDDSIESGVVTDNLAERIKIALDEMDPTPTKSYSRWILQTYLSGGIKAWEDLHRVRIALEGYDGLKKRRLFTPENNKDFWGRGAGAPNLNDIFNIKKLRDLEDIVEHFLTEFGEISSREEEAELEKQAKAGSEITDYPQCKVIHPTTERAACWWGRGSRWCTATKNPEDSMFNSYNSGGDLYILIPKNPKHKGEKYQIHVPNDVKSKHLSDVPTSISFMDEKDDYADLQKFLKDPVYAKPLQDLLGVEENDEFVKFLGRWWKRRGSSEDDDV